MRVGAPGEAHSGGAAKKGPLGPPSSPRRPTGWAFYLETTNPGIIAFYQRQGFKLVGEQPVAGGGLTVWGMVREPA